MPREVHDEGDHYRIEYDDELDAIIHTWTEFSTGEAFRDGANESLEVIRSQRPDNLIVDTRNVQAHQDGDKRWLQEEWVPKIIDAGVEKSATVHADSVIAEMEMEEFSEDMEQPEGIDLFITGDMDEAREWVSG